MKHRILILALLCAVVQGAWAQASWEEVYAMTNTTTADWTQLNVGSVSGGTLGAAGTTTYYYADANLTFSNSTAGGSGLTILGTVYLYVPQDVTLTCTGANADGQTGAGAGIELAAGNALYLIGQGAVNATGGNAANGVDGTNGSDADWDNSNYWSGTGGTGGHGGGGAGAGIGTRGGDGGQGGAGAASTVSAWSTDFGRCGSNGETGATAGAMGGLCVSTSFGNVTATGGAAASRGGSAGSAGKGYLYDGSSYNYSAAGGGGGGGGGFGGAASNIGTGGPGGGGGGGGASSNLDYAASGYYVVKAPGGKGGQNADGTWAAAGTEGIMNHNGFKNGQVITNGSGWDDDAYNYDSYVSSQGVGIGGSGSAAGNASTSESAISITTNTALPTQEEWAVVCRQTNTSQSQWTALPFGTSMGATLGTAGTTTYYYATGDRTFINANAGGSGLTIQGTVYLFVAAGQTITCKGANAGGQTGAGAGIELTAGNSLFLLGQGEVNATGGNAANGSDGTNGSDADWDNSNYWSGTGGTGGHGGGGAGAGIGTRGGDGGNGGAGAASVTSAWSTAGGGSGAAGQAGATAGSMGELYVAQSFVHLTTTGGAAASRGGSAGSAGKSALYDGYEYNWSAAGGGGGGGGGFGGAATGIGTGGPGGGGGGGGASGNLDWARSGYYVVKAPGGKGGQNADGTWAAAGAESIMNHHAIKNGQVKINASGWEADKYNYDSYVSTQPVGTGGSGGALGAASTSESAITMTVKLPSQSEWDMVCFQTQTSQSDWATLPFGARKGATIGAAGTTTYYFATGDGSFTNINAGGSGLTIKGTVYLYIPAGMRISCTGTHANSATGAGAGIELEAGNTLYLIGGGKLVATGGNAANGSNGGKGSNASFDAANVNWVKSGEGGRGGDGGGGAGAGIGTRGGDGGAGGAGGAPKQNKEDTSGNVGSNGADGSTAAEMGTLYIYQLPAPTTEIHGGSCGTRGGNGGTGGLHAYYEVVSDFGYHWTMGGGGGGAGGGFGGAASDIGTGGPGGGGGGGGSSGSIMSRYYVYTTFYQVGALGGNPGTNVDGTLAGAGASTLLDRDDNSLLAQRSERMSVKNEVLFRESAGWYDGDNRAAGGKGGGTGSASQSGSVITVEAESFLQGSGTEGDPIIISRAAEWEIIAFNVSNGNSYSGKYVELKADIEVRQKMGTVSGFTLKNAFSGTFIGGNHTITANISDRNPGTALFCHINNATIRDLNVVGTINGDDYYCAALVGIAVGTCSIENCTVAATITGRWFVGGLVGTARGDISISGCAFSGLIKKDHFTGIFIGPEGNGNWTITDCLYVKQNGQKTSYFDIVKGSGSLTMTNCYKTTSAGTQCTFALATATAPANLGALVKDYGMVKAYENGILYDGTYYVAPATLTLADNADNSTTISDAHGYLGDVTLQDRTLYKDGAWNTLCLPFNVTLAGSPLEGAVARPLTEGGISGTTLNLTFGEAVTELVAGTPYIIKWDGGNDIVSPVFSGVTIDATMHPYDSGEAEGDQRVRFTGTYSSMEFADTDNSILLMGGENMLYYPTTGAGLGAQHAYFKIGGDGAKARRITGFSIDFGDSETTGIISAEANSSLFTIPSSLSEWYTIHGVKLDGKPTRSGIYINGGRKVVIK